jgi:hypothetical protein
MSIKEYYACLATTPHSMQLQEPFQQWQIICRQEYTDLSDPEVRTIIMRGLEAANRLIAGDSFPSTEPPVSLESAAAENDDRDVQRIEDAHRVHVALLLLSKVQARTQVIGDMRTRVRFLFQKLLTPMNESDQKVSTLLSGAQMGMDPDDYFSDKNIQIMATCLRDFAKVLPVDLGLSVNSDSGK